MAGSMAMRHLNSSGSICRCCASNGTQSIFLSPCFSAATGKFTISERLEFPKTLLSAAKFPGSGAFSSRREVYRHRRQKIQRGKHMSQVILHHYPLSPYSEKTRLALGLKGATWSSVEIPVWTPRPKLTPMTGGYRRTPILQVGAEFYCDTLHILRTVEELGTSGARKVRKLLQRLLAGGSRKAPS